MGMVTTGRACSGGTGLERVVMECSGKPTNGLAGLVW